MQWAQGRLLIPYELTKYLSILRSFGCHICNDKNFYFGFSLYFLHVFVGQPVCSQTVLNMEVFSGVLSFPYTQDHNDTPKTNLPTVALNVQTPLGKTLGTLSQWAMMHVGSDATGFHLLTFSVIFVMKWGHLVVFRFAQPGLGWCYWSEHDLTHLYFEVYLLFLCSGIVQSLYCFFLSSLVFSSMCLWCFLLPCFKNCTYCSNP